jgi:aryl-alcohol dehydrogenase-like predicted oxidoreductase
VLDGTLTKETVFDPDDHRNHRRQEWLKQGLEKLAHLQFLVDELDSSIGQSAIKFALSGTRVATVLPNITNEAQMLEFAAAPETEDIPVEFVARLQELFDENFYLEPLQEPSAAI